jgi:hypothetical protein
MRGRIRLLRVLQEANGQNLGQIVMAFDFDVPQCTVLTLLLLLMSRFRSVIEERDTTATEAQFWEAKFGLNPAVLNIGFQLVVRSQLRCRLDGIDTSSEIHRPLNVRALQQVNMP